MCYHFALFLALLSGSLFAQQPKGPPILESSDDAFDFGADNVRGKLFPKAEKIELNLDVGGIITGSFINTYLLRAGINYYFDEQWGVGIEGFNAIPEQRGERECLETWYNNEDNPQLDNTKQTCDAAGNNLPNDGTSNYGPAYMPICEFKYLLAANALWSPIYGKQLLWLSATSYFDFFVVMGGGLAFSTYYPKSTTLRDGRLSRAGVDTTQTPARPKTGAGAGANETHLVGESGRPDSEEEIHPFINLGIAQRYHFFERWSVRLELRNMTLLGTPTGFENYVALWAGGGLRF